MNTPTKIASAVASLGVLAVGWSVGTASGRTLTAADTATAPATTSQATTASTRPAQPTTRSAPMRHDEEESDDYEHDDDDHGGAAAPSTSGSGSASSSGSAGTSGSTGTAPAKPTASGTFTGTTASHRYGSVTVTVTLNNGTITGLTEKVVSDGDRHSSQINQRAVPTLKSALIGTDGSTASTISGATYTTDAYLTSLQSALDQAV